jgi:hypothetical protein
MTGNIYANVENNQYGSVSLDIQHWLELCTNWPVLYRPIPNLGGNKLLHKCS